VRERVQAFLTSEGPVEIDSEHRWRVLTGSTRVFVDVIASVSGVDFAIVRMVAPILHDVPLSAELYEYVALNADNGNFGSLGLWPDEEKKTALLLVRHSLLADYLDKEELLQAVYAVGSAADELDDQLQERFGGTRNIDP
jgi:hypothetical protein